MSRHRMRSSWVAGDSDGDQELWPGARRRRLGLPGRRWLAVTAMAAGASVVAAVAIVSGVGAGPALALCDSTGGACVDTASGPTPAVAILPIGGRGGDSLTVSNRGADGATEVGVVGYVTSEDTAGSTITTASPTTAATVQLSSGQQKVVRLSQVPTAARAVIVQTGSSFARSTSSRSRAACSASDDGTEPATSNTAPTSDETSVPTAAAAEGASGCSSAVVSFSGRHDKVPAAQVVVALRNWTAKTATPMPTTTALAAFTQRVDPATLAAAIAPGAKSLVVSWKLDAGAEKVSAVRVTRSGPDGSTAAVSQMDLAPTDGTRTLSDLTAGSSYTVTVAPVVDGATRAPIIMTATALAKGMSASSTDSTPSASPTSSPKASSASPSATATSRSGGAPVSAASTAPASSSSGSGLPGSDAYSGWTRVIGQDFGTDAAVGSFASKYPGWAGYDGSTSGASGTTWNSSTTMSVSDSVLRMRNWVSNGKAQAGALTPLVPGTGAWQQQAQTYGKYVVRFKADSVKGFKVAWLLWPSSGNWSDGEIDFPEANLDGTVNWSAHDVTGNPSNQTWGATSTRMADGQWHTATTTWVPGKVTYELDGAVVKTVTDPKFLPTKAMRWDLQNETSTDGSKPAADADGSVYIDWVAQYSRN